MICPLWEPSKRICIGMLFIADYIDTLRMCQQSRVPYLEVVQKPVRDVLHASVGSFSHYMFHPVDAEDPVYEMLKRLQQCKAEFVPITGGDDGRLVGVLGYMDLVHLMYQASVQFPQLFMERVENLRSASPSRSGVAVPVALSSVTVPRQMLLSEVLSVMHSSDLSGVPVVDEEQRVIGMYNKEDMSFIGSVPPEAQEAVIAKALDTEIGSIVAHQQADPGAQHPLCTCVVRDSIKDVLERLMTSRAFRVVCVDEQRHCLFTVCIADIVRYYFD